MREISWIRAYAGSAVIHLLVVGAAAVFLAGAVMQQEQQQMYVIDLDTSELSSAGSGHAGGGGGGELFPEKLSEEVVAERTAQIDASQSAVMPHPQPAAPVPDAVQGTPSSPAAGNVSTGGTGTGSGAGTGTGSGVGDGTGDGQGYGDGAGDGQGSGYSGAEGTGSSPFDSDGFWSAVNANKSYPPMAVRRGLTGSVTVTVTLDGSGNCVNAYVSGSSGQSLLDKAALNAVYAACPYPNASGQDITVNVPVTFSLN